MDGKPKQRAEFAKFLIPACHFEVAVSSAAPRSPMTEGNHDPVRHSLKAMIIAGDIEVLTTPEGSSEPSVVGGPGRATGPSPRPWKGPARAAV